MVNVWLHSTSDASPSHPNAAAALGAPAPAALLLLQILPVFSVVARLCATPDFHHGLSRNERELDLTGDRLCKPEKRSAERSSARRHPNVIIPRGVELCGV